MKTYIQLKVPFVALMILVISSMAFGRLMASAQGLALSIASDNSGTLQYESANGEYLELSKLDSINFIAWNDDGTKLAFIKHTSVVNDKDVREIGVVEFDADGNPSEPLILQTARPDFGYNLDWMSDGRILFVTQNPEANPETGIYDKRDIAAVSLGNESDVLGTITLLDGCGGGSPFPTDWRYGIEMGGSLGGFFLTLTETPNGIVVSGDCGGSVQMLLNPATGESTQIANNYSKAVVSPDGQRVAGVQFSPSNWENSDLIIYDLVSGESVIVPTNDDPDLIVWSHDGSSLYYTTRAKHHNILTDYSGNERAILDIELRSVAGEVPSYRVALYHVELTTMDDMLVYDGDHFAIGRMFDTPLGVFISVIPNLDMWVSMIANRQMAPADEQAGIAIVEVGTFLIEQTDTSFGEPIFWGFYELFTPFVR